MIGNKIIDYEVPKTGVIINVTRRKNYVVRWHNHRVSLVKTDNIKFLKCGSRYRYEIL